MDNVIPNYDKLTEIIEYYEGFSFRAYLDSGKIWTIGYGSTFNFALNRKVQEGDFITKETAKKWFATETQNVVKQCNQYIKQKLSPDQSTAIVDYVYNRGIGNFLKTNLDELINANPYNKAIASEIIGTGLKDRVGNLLWGLGRRRRTEATLYFTGLLQFDFPRWSNLTF